MSLPDYSIELSLASQLGGPVAGLDEAGCGPLAGPVVAAAVILDQADIPAGLNDSKKLTAKAREALYDVILARARATSIASVPHGMIDGLNIRTSALLAMRQALAALAIAPAFALVDGRNAPPGLCCPCRTIVRGDSISASIAAASILAKVTRDRLMQRLHQQVPVYGFAQHMGYGTRDHLAAIALYGPSPWHRLSFAPMRDKG